jgi:hypothetical protein
MKGFQFHLNRKFINRKTLAIIVAFVLIASALLVFVMSAPPSVQAQSTVTPSPTPTAANTATLTPTAIATGVANPAGNGIQYLICGRYGFGNITPGACLQIYNGSDSEGYATTGRRTYLMDAETGNVTIYGSLAQGTTGTKCVSSTQSITGSGTVVPGTLSGAGISTPSAVMASLASDSTGDLSHVSTTKASGVVTLKVWNSALTPAASSGAANVDFIVCGQ